MINDLNVREAVKTGSRDGSIDGDCFQLLFEQEILTLRAPNVSERRQWINQIESAKKAVASMKKVKSLDKLASKGQAIGTLNVLLVEAKNSKNPASISL